MLDAEKRSLEDIIYRQEAEYEMAIKQLKKCRTERDANKIDSGDNGMPAVEMPAVEIPAVEIPAVEIPGVDIPGVDIPGVDIPGVDIPGVESPGGTGIPNVQPNPIPNFNPAPNNPAPNNPAPVNPLSNDPAPNLGPLPAPVGPQTNIPVGLQSFAYRDQSSADSRNRDGSPQRRRWVASGRGAKESGRGFIFRNLVG